MLRLSCLLVSLLALPAHAAVTAAPVVEVAPLAPAAVDASATGAEPVAAEPVAPEPVAAEAPSPVMDAVEPSGESDPELLHQQQLQSAAKRIEVLRATVKATTPQQNFLSGLFSSSVRPVDSELLAEMDRFIARFSELPETAQVYQMKAQLHQRIESYHAAAVDWLMLLASYPASPLADEAHKALKQLAGDKLKKQAVTLQAMTDKLDLLSGNREQRVAGFLVFAGRLSEKEFAAPIAAEAAAFLVRNRSYPDEDRILDVLGHQQMQLDNEMAIYYFNELQALYPASPLLPESLLSVGNVQRNGLKHYPDAAVSFKAVIAKFPDSDEAKHAYESLADMYDQDMRDYSNAIKTYDAIIARYKNDSVVLRSLQSLARIYQSKTNQPLEAIAAYRKLADIFKDKDGLAALVQAEKLARYTVSDWKLSIEINRSIVNGYPKNDEAVQALYDNAGLYEEKLKDREQALKLYQEVLHTYPDHKLARDAKRHIVTLKQQN